ncbi:phage terminase large subunit, partial [Escherichia coli]|uniref:phage terminase large subunit n=1 Tax=Escherichia coli TaxID=562 RepID=UPI001F25794D
LKGIDKSASVSSVGISAQLAGKRADFLLADDIEVMRNSMTQTEREKLALQTREFSAICIHGDIMYLGTPQTKDSIYRELPRRGFSVRVWTGRYPTNEELERYGSGTEIAPIIMKRLLENPELQTGGGIEGNRGQPTDPNHIGEETLQSKELDYGP